MDMGVTMETTFLETVSQKVTNDTNLCRVVVTGLGLGLGLGLGG